MFFAAAGQKTGIHVAAGYESQTEMQVARMRDIDGRVRGS